MILFCGQEQCLIDANGRIKLPPRFLQAFNQFGTDIVLHCLPEGALGIYPASTWEQMRAAQPPAPQSISSALVRRQLRRFAAFTQVEALSNQGRVTIPALFREPLQLAPKAEVVLVGCDIGVEAWNLDCWERETEQLREHERQRAEAEMQADLLGLRQGLTTN